VTVEAFPTSLGLVVVNNLSGDLPYRRELGESHSNGRQTNDQEKKEHLLFHSL
jgi:hypothetical protein